MSLIHLPTADSISSAGSDPGKANLPVSISPTFRYASAGYKPASASWQVDAKINYVSLFASFIPDIQTCGEITEVAFWQRGRLNRPACMSHPNG